jgi:dihydrolipoamide dehydrogenase
VSELEIRVPDIGDFADVPVIEILVSPGDEVAVEDPLVSLESDKATMDVPSPSAGTVGQLRVKVGDRVSEGSVLVTLSAAEAESAGAKDEATEEPKEAATAGAAGSAEVPTEAGESSVKVTSEPEPAPSGGGEFQVVVLGSGPGGYTAAFRAADLGLKTALVERQEQLGGVCLNVGCIPSKALLHAARVIAEVQDLSSHGIAYGSPKIDLSALLGFKQDAVDRLTGGLAQLAKQRKVEVIHGEAQLTGRSAMRVGDREVTFDNCVIAAGSESAWLPFLPEDPRIINSTGALSPGEIPKRMLVIGCGIIGLEMATVYDALGSRVTVVEVLDQLIPGCDPDLVRPLHKRVQGRYEAIHLSTQVTAVKAQKNGLKVEFSGDVETQQFDRILVAVGRVPNGKRIGAGAAGVTVDDRGFIPVDTQMRTNVPGIFAIGDIVGNPMLAHKATHQGKVAAEVIAGIAGAAFDARAIPSVAYTDPEVAWMGLTETAAKADGIAYEKQTFPWVASGRALGLGRPEGMTKLLFGVGGAESQRLLGAGIVGVNAGDLIAETVLALELGADAEDIGLSIHPHPTLAETIAFAAEMEAGTITDLLPPRRKR